MKEYLDFAVDIAYKAGNIMKKYFNQNNGAYYKNDKTIVTIADNEINEMLIDNVKNKFPSHCVDGEEKQFNASNYVWVCDPIDGTAMFARHIPVAVFSLALVIDGVPNVAVVYDPWTNNLYSAIKNEGAYKNGEKISVNNNTIDDISTVGHFDFWKTCELDIQKTINELQKRCYMVSIGSIIRASVAVATGELTFCIFPGTVRKHCDIAGVKLIVEEAGGKVTNFLGQEQRYDRDIYGAVITNNKVHNEILSIIKNNLK